MNTIAAVLNRLLTLAGIKDFSLESDAEHRRISLIIRDEGIIQKEQVATLIEDVNHLAQMIARRHALPFVRVDINNHRREREDLIRELSRAAARKAVATRRAVDLPGMNAYERRIVHTELSVHPDVRTESTGVRSGRHVVVMPITA
ncbi:MAG: hypothetical protein HYS43_01975 [Candidatus Liptonbacteria bacterium]|nr:hypothetical protein [Candidatus Liptonbacteria bacterium]